MKSHPVSTSFTKGSHSGQAGRNASLVLFQDVPNCLIIEQLGLKLEKRECEEFCVNYL
jgi:hypothetical protein